MEGIELTAGWHRQVELERSMRGSGIDRFRSALNKAREQGREGEVGAGLLLMKQVVAPLTKAIEDFITEARAGKAGRKHLAYHYLVDMKADVVAFLTAKVVIDQLSQNKNLRRATLHRLLAYSERAGHTRLDRRAKRWHLTDMGCTTLEAFIAIFEDRLTARGVPISD
ncbi:MAG: hypothetical protein ACK4FJ_17270 [Ferrovibrio sp.]|uniref:hypothetical protein n=1 Tax=Ferrovibrio sp. TaxID=1917215 RepID=UPI003918CB06